MLGTLELIGGEHHLGGEFNVFFRWQADNRWQWVGVAGLFWPGKVKEINARQAKTATNMSLQILLILQNKYQSRIP